MSSFIDGSTSYHGPVNVSANGAHPANDEDCPLDGTATHVNGFAATGGTASSLGLDGPVSHVNGTAATNVVGSLASVDGHGHQTLPSRPLPDQTMPIAIIGMGCRFPGDATDPEKLWEMCSQSRDAWSEIPAEKFNLKAFYHPDPERSGSVRE